MRFEKVRLKALYSVTHKLQCNMSRLISALEHKVVGPLINMQIQEILDKSQHI